MSITIDTLKPQLTRLRLNGLLSTLPMRLEQGRENGLPYLEILHLLLQDEVERREADCVRKRLQTAKFSGLNQTFESLVMRHYPPELVQRLQELKSLHFMSQLKHVILMGPTGTGKTHIAQAIGHQACRMRKTVLFYRTNALLQQLHAARADGSYTAAMKRFCQPDLLILDDFGLTPLTQNQAEDIYELIAIRAHQRPLVITSNRTVDAWVALFPDPVMANAILDRLANVAYQILIEGESYRKHQRVDLKIVLDDNT